MNIRETLNKSPMVGWGLAGVLLLVAVGMFLFRKDGEGPAPTDKVMVLFTDTGEQVEMYRGRLEREMMLVAGPIDPSKGIVNPATGKPSGVILDKAEWERTCAKLNADKKEAQAKSKAGAKNPAPK
jgi:hypothetical protein